MTGSRSVFCPPATRWECVSEGGKTVHCVSPPMTIIPFSRFTCPSLTTAAHDYDNVTSRTVETLVQLVESGGQLASRTETLFPARLILRDSA
jgi:hypothetical protein